MLENLVKTSEDVEKWRSELSLNDLPHAANSLFQVLKNISALDLPAKKRFKILSLLRPTMGYICQSLQKLYGSEELLTSAQLAVADLVYRLRLEMLKGYKLVIDESENTFFKNNKLLLSAFQNAMLYCSKMLIQCYEHYRPAPPLIWLDLHALYKLAEQKKLLKKSLAKTLDWSSNLKTLEDIYHYCLLFSLANPYQFRLDEIILLNYAIESWAPLVKLCKNTTSTSSLFMVDPSSDAPPFSVTQTKPNAQECYSIHLNKVNQHLTLLLTNLITKKRTDADIKFTDIELTIPYPYIESILHAWQSVKPKQVFQPAHHEEISVCLGIGASYKLINQNVSLIKTQLLESESSSSAIEIIDINVLPELTPGLPAPHISTTKDGQQHRCVIVNHSMGGYGLEWREDVPVLLKCGEIILLPNPHNVVFPWSIGNIQWLRQDVEETIHFGVRVLSTQVMAVQARLMNNASQNIESILLLSKPNIPHIRTLVTALLPFKTQLEIEIEYEGKSYVAKLDKTLGYTRSYQEFEITFVDNSFPFLGQKSSSLKKDS